MLHITNGDSTRVTLERSGVPGTCLAWRDVLHDGPVPTRAPLAEFRRVRAAFLALGGFGTAHEIEKGYEQEDAAVLSWSTRDETVLWFEHDLYDQLLLIRLLSMVPPEAATKVTLVQSSEYLGPLPPSAFPTLFRNRGPITPEQIALAARAWHAYGEDTPAPLLQVMDGDTTALPFLDGALRRHFEDYPDAHGLSRTERQMLEEVAGGVSTAGDLFRACAAREERIYMGDWTFFEILRQLDGLVIFRLKPEATRFQPEATRLKPEGTQLQPEATRIQPEATRLKPEGTQIQPEATRLKPERSQLQPEATRLKPEGTQLQPEATRLQPEATRLRQEATRLQPEGTRLQPESSVALTGAGRDVLEGYADRIALSGIDRWMGGVHLTPERPWRRPVGSWRPQAP